MGRGRLAKRASALKREIVTLAYAYRHPGVPWYSKLLIMLTIAYALSPLDLIPDFIPVLGLLDDLVILPLGILLSIRSIPKEVLEECRKRASEPVKDPRLRRTGLILVLGSWLLLLAVVAVIVLRRLL